MASVTAPRKASKASRPFTCSFISITIEIQDTRYSVDEVPAGEFGRKAFRLCKHSGNHEVYDVIHDAFGCVACSCPDYIARHDGTSSMCKHGRALVALGLMPGPAPIAPPAPEPCCSPAEAEPCIKCIDVPASADDSPTAIEPDPAPEPAADLVDPDDAGSDPELWPDGYDDHIWNLAPAEMAEARGEKEARGHLDASDRLTLAELVDRQADFYRSWGNAAGGMLARAMEALAMKVRMTGAETPDDFDAREGELDAAARETWEAIGFEQGRMACQGEPAGTAFGHMA